MHRNFTGFPRPKPGWFGHAQGMTTPDNPDTPTNPVSVPQAPAPRSGSNTLLVKIAAVVGIVAGAFVILGVTFGLGVLAGSQCGGHGGHGGPGEHGRHMMMFDRGDGPSFAPPRGPVIIERGGPMGPPDGPPAPGERRQLPSQPSAPTPAPSQTVPRP